MSQTKESQQKVDLSQKYKRKTSADSTSQSIEVKVARRSVEKVKKSRNEDIAVKKTQDPEEVDIHTISEAYEETKQAELLSGDES